MHKGQLTSHNYELAAGTIIKFKFPSYYTMLLNYRVAKHQIISINQGSHTVTLQSCTNCLS